MHQIYYLHQHLHMIMLLQAHVQQGPSEVLARPLVKTIRLAITVTNKNVRDRFFYQENVIKI